MKSVIKFTQNKKITQIITQKININKKKRNKKKLHKVNIK